MPVITPVIRPKHADGLANQVSESPGNPALTGPRSGAPAIAATADNAPTFSPTWSRTFPALADQVGEARRFLGQILGGSALAEDALLCLSELASNSILHSNSRRPSGHFTVRISQHWEGLRVEVEDEGGPWECPTPDDHRGRGLVIVDRLSTAWAVIGVGNASRIVWFEISNR